MDYTSLKSIPYYTECSSVLEPLDLRLVELQVVPQHGAVKVTCVISSADCKMNVGVADCSKAHKALQPKLLSLLNKTEDDLSMEVCSPGIERNLKNACEFEIFMGHEIRVWSREAGEWISGVIKASTETEVVLETEGGSEKTVAYNDIAKAKFIHL